MQQDIASKYTSSTSYIPPYVPTIFNLLFLNDTKIIKVFLALIMHVDGHGKCYPGHNLLADLSHLCVETVDNVLDELFKKGWLRGHLVKERNSAVKLVYQVSPELMYISDNNRLETLLEWECADVRAYVPPQDYDAVWLAIQQARRTQLCWYGKDQGVVTQSVTQVGQPTTEPSSNNQNQKTNSLKPTTTDSSDGKKPGKAKSQSKPSINPTPPPTKTVAAAPTPTTDEITSTAPKQAEIATEVATTVAKPQRTSPPIQVPPPAAPVMSASDASTPTGTGFYQTASTPLSAVNPTNSEIEIMSDPGVEVTEAEINRLAAQIAGELASTTYQMKKQILKHGYHQAQAVFEYVCRAKEHPTHKPNNPAGLLVDMLKKGDIPPRLTPQPRSLTGKYAAFFDR
ncbi:MAG TPA: hypothetical protein VHL11_03185 [Phototrophicaceae bacterium]|jgi:hypothetical protein|nr:hypothetical protein [Phototrophicaceae bacterium]